VYLRKEILSLLPRLKVRSEIQDAASNYPGKAYGYLRYTFKGHIEGRIAVQLPGSGFRGHYND
jgi:hypothetical protein